MRASVVIAAAGAGERLGAGRPKALVELSGRPLFEWALVAARAAGAIDDVVLAAPPGHEKQFEREGITVVPGGASRSESVRNALAQAGGEVIVVHDAARPLAEPELFDRVVEALARDPGLDGAITALPVSDTVKRVGNEGEVLETLDRSRLRAVQTPQAFRRAALERALEGGDLESATDDAALIEADGGRIVVVDGSPHNLKVTGDHDLRIAALLLG